MMRLLVLAMLLSGCAAPPDVRFEVVDTDFSKGRLGHRQELGLADLELFHGHLCDGLVVGAQALHEGLAQLFPDGIIDRTDLRIISAPSPCITDAAIYVTGGRYQFNTFYVDGNLGALYHIQRISTGKAVSVRLKKGVKPSAIDSLGTLAVQQNLSPCGIDSLHALEDAFTEFLLHAGPNQYFQVTELADFTWNPLPRNDFVKTDVVNKNAPVCRAIR